MTKSRNQDYIDAFGRNIRKLRMAKGLTMTELANLCDVEYRQISDVELGKISTSLATIYQIAQGLEISPKDLFDFEL